MRAAVVALAAALCAGGVIGFANAAHLPASDLPARFGVAAPRVGDHGAYTYETWRQTPEGGRHDETGRRMLEFEWVGTEPIPDPDGRQVASLQLATSQTRANQKGWYTSNRTWSLDPETLQPLAWTAVSRSTYRQVHQHPIFGPDVDEGTSSSRQTYYSSPEERAWPLCLSNSLQGEAGRVLGPVRLFPRCQLGPFRFDETRFEPILHLGSGGQTSVLFRSLSPVDVEILPFYDLGEYLPAAGVYVWLRADVPYPTQVLLRTDDRYAALRLSGFQAGSRTLVADPPGGDAPPAMTFGPRKPWGPDDTGLKHPFPLSAAFTFARDDPENDTLRTFLALHPKSYVQRALYDEHVDRYGVTTRYWSFVVTNGRSHLATGAFQDTVQPPVEGLPPLDEHGVQSIGRLGVQGLEPRGPVPAPEQLPGIVPSLKAVAARWRAQVPLTAEASEFNTWGFEWTCEASCAEPNLELKAGASRWWARFNETNPAAGDESGYDGSWLYVDAAGRTTRFGITSRHLQDDPLLPLPGEPQPEAEDPGVVLAGLETRVWTLPTGRYAVATGLAALVAALVYFLWPALKQGVAVLLYSRVEAPTALDHPVRSHLLGLIEASPGIHFQELHRRAGVGRGTTEHHLETLVRVGLVSREIGPGYTCYFPKGTVDRRLMAAAPLLKAAGARRLLEAVARSPGVSAVGVARATGLTQATVSYHLGRLAGVGLVTVAREGKARQVRLTDLGRAALGGGAAA